MRKNMIVFRTIVLLSFGSIVASPSANAESIADMQVEKKNIEKQRNEAQAGIELALEEIRRLQAEQAKMIEGIQRIEVAINVNDLKVLETQTEIEQQTAGIQQLENEIAVLEEKFESRHTLLEHRARAFQESGGKVGYLEVLLGSSSFGEFIERAVAVSAIAEADQEILKQTKNDQQLLEKKQAAVKVKLAELKGMKTEFEGMLAQLTEQKAQKDVLMAQLKGKEKENAEVTAALRKRDGMLALEEVTITQNIELELKRLAELEAAKRKEAEERQRRLLESADENEEYIYTSADVNAGDVVTVGNKWIGNSAYVFGGGRNQYDIENGLFDCSSFVHWAFLQTGIKLGPLTSVSTETLKHLGKQVPASKIQPGDLVFFDTYKKDGHVGIYVGDGKFIGAQSSTGVAIADMTEGYWLEKFNGRIKRI